MRRKRKPDHAHSVADYQKAIETVKLSQLSKRKRKRMLQRIVNKMVDMI